MSLIFSDGQIKNITKDTLLLPILIDDPVNGTGYIQQRDNALILKDSLFLTDQDLKVFSDLWISVVGKYHIELDWLKADLRSDYSELILQSGGQQTPPHFPSSPPWINLSPKVADSNTGLPIAPSLSDIEMIILPDLTASISTLKTGFSEGSFSAAVLNVTGTQFEIVYVDGSSELGDLAIGQQIIIYGSGLATLAEITGIQIPPEPTPPETEYDNHIILYDVISGHTGSIGGATVANSHPGFTNAQRGRQEAISGEQEAIRAIFEADVDNNVGRWEIPLSNQKDALDSNNELEPRKTANTAALVNVEAAIGDIVVWEALPVIDPNGKYTDTGFNSIETQIVTRTAQVPGRILEIEGTQLGTLIQDGAGDFTGAGVYFDLFTFVNLRISRATGSLFKYIQSDKSVELFEKRINDATAQLDQYTNVFAITKLSGDTEIGDTVFQVEDASEFSISTEVMFMDNESIIYRRNILIIDANEITVDDGIPVALTRNNLARMVKQK